jgi:DNA-binding response OmpR family regulator
MSLTAQRKIMVIGFDENFCYLMERFCRISACQLALANHQEDILVQVRRDQPAVIFLEVAHPTGPAWSMFAALKTCLETHAIPVVICSWQGEESDGQHPGADYYLRLPILYEHFKSALEHV